MDRQPMANDDLAKFLLRLAVGGLLLFHGIQKLIHGVDPIRGMLAKHGWPEWMAWGVFAGEVLAPVLIVLGFLTRPAALVVAFNMAVSIYLAFGADAFSLNEQGGLRVELNLLYLFGALAIFFAGGGGYSARKGAGRWD